MQITLKHSSTGWFVTIVLLVFAAVMGFATGAYLVLWCADTTWRVIR